MRPFFQEKIPVPQYRLYSRYSTSTLPGTWGGEISVQIELPALNRLEKKGEDDRWEALSTHFKSDRPPPTKTARVCPNATYYHFENFRPCLVKSDLTNIFPSSTVPPAAHPAMHALPRDELIMCKFIRVWKSKPGTLRRSRYSARSIIFRVFLDVQESLCLFPRRMYILYCTPGPSLSISMQFESKVPSTGASQSAQ